MTIASSEKQRIYQKAYKEKHRVKLLHYTNEKVKEHYKRNKEDILEKKKIYYQDNKELYKENYQWKKFINNTNLNVEKKIFLMLLLN